jgi:octaprenyl-diphosphate synthase
VVLTRGRPSLIRLSSNVKVASHDIATSIAVLTEVSERAGERAAERLAQVRAVLAEDMDAVDDALARLARDGASPAAESATYLLEAGGKRVRPLTVLLAAACFGPPPRAARDLAVAAELVHLATLLHDDVIDDGELRRGRTASRRIWGNAVSVLAGDLLLTHALERTAAAAPSMLRDLFATLRRLVDGEVVQLRGRAHVDAGEDVYFRIVRGKTASLFAWAARAGASCAGAPPDAVAALGEFGGRLGVAFQLVDDVLDYVGDPRETGKALLGDLADGKLTLPLIRAIGQNPGLVDELAAVRAGDEAAALRLAEAVRSANVCDGVRARARHETTQAIAALQRVAPSEARDLLGAIACELAARAA